MLLAIDNAGPFPFIYKVNCPSMNNTERHKIRAYCSQLIPSQVQTPIEYQFYQRKPGTARII